MKIPASPLSPEADCLSYGSDWPLTHSQLGSGVSPSGVPLQGHSFQEPRDAPRNMRHQGWAEIRPQTLLPQGGEGSSGLEQHPDLSQPCRAPARAKAEKPSCLQWWLFECKTNIPYSWDKVTNLYWLNRNIPRHWNLDFEIILLFIFFWIAPHTSLFIFPLCQLHKYISQQE